MSDKSRRQVLLQGAALAAVTSTAGCSCEATPPRAPSDEWTETVIDTWSPDSGDATTLPDTGHADVTLPLADYPALAVVGGSADAGGPATGPLIVARISESEFACVTNRCTHQSCPLQFADASSTFSCLCHGSQFDLDGTVLRGPAILPVEAFPVTFDGEVVTVHFSTHPAR